MIPRFFKSKKGFTLIELLVVIAIIGVLASIVLASLNTARLKGRDVRRIADIGQLRLALELYFDSFRGYPVGNAIGSLTGVLDPTYIGSIPRDPLTAQTYTFQSHNNDSPITLCAAPSTTCAGYVLGARLEDATHGALATDFDTTVGTVTCTDNGGVSPDANRYYCLKN